MSEVAFVGIDRWPRQSADEEVASVDCIHARERVTDEMTLCERGGGPVVPSDSVTLCLDLARAHPSTVTRPVDCPDCLEWLHA